MLIVHRMDLRVTLATKHVLEAVFCLQISGRKVQSITKQHSPPQELCIAKTSWGSEEGEYLDQPGWQCSPSWLAPIPQMQKQNKFWGGRKNSEAICRWILEGLSWGLTSLQITDSVTVILEVQISTVAFQILKSWNPAELHGLIRGVPWEFQRLWNPFYLAKEETAIEFSVLSHTPSQAPWHQSLMVESQIAHCLQSVI